MHGIPRAQRREAEQGGGGGHVERYGEREVALVKSSGYASARGFGGGFND